MGLFSIVSRIGRGAEMNIFEIEGVRFALPMGVIVAHTVWLNSRAGLDSDDRVMGYTSHEARLVPIFDLAKMQGLPHDSQARNRLLILNTIDGYAAIPVDRFLGNGFADHDVRVLRVEELFSAIFQPVVGHAA